MKFGGLGRSFGRLGSYGAAGEAAFDPSTVSPSMWLDPSDLTSLFQDDAGTTPVAANNDPVGKCNDKSGNGNHIAQATAGARPLYMTGSGLHWIDFDGVDNFLDQVTLIEAVLTSTTFDMVVAAQADEVTTNAADATFYDNDCIWSHGANGEIGLAFKSTGKILLGNNDGSIDVAEDDYTIGTPFVCHIRHDGAGNISLTLNSRTTVTVASGTTSGFAGRILRFGVRYNATAPFTDLRLYGVIAKQTLFTAGELTSVKAYLAAKAGVTL